MRDQWDLRADLLRYFDVFPKHEQDRWPFTVEDLANGIVATIANYPAAEWVRLHHAVRLMRATVSHTHTAPWPCPVKLVDDALAATTRIVGYDAPYPPDLAALHRDHIGEYDGAERNAAPRDQ